MSVVPAEATTRDIALVLAGLHLRLGSMSLARAELETLATSGRLDHQGRIDLAEVRWRTGDLTGAGAAASKALSSDETSIVALVIAAEAASALGRPSEARRLAGRALALSDGPIDPVFAGMSRSGVWPADPSEPTPAPVALFPTERVAAWSQASAPSLPPMSTEALVDEDADVQPGIAPTRGGGAAGAVPETGLWDLPDPGAVSASSAGTVAGVPLRSDGERLFEAARFALESADVATAAVRLGLVVRLAPELAPQILDLVGATRDPGLLVVRGDALLAIGQDDAATASFRSALAMTVPALEPAPVVPAGPVVEPSVEPPAAGVEPPVESPTAAADPTSTAKPERGPRRRRRRG